MGLLLSVLNCAAADVVTVYRCVATDGSVALQDSPCPEGEDSEERHYRHDDGTDAGDPPAPVLSAPAPATERRPKQRPAQGPPLRWRCVDYQGEVRISERDDPRGRWLPAWVLGYGSEPSGLAGRAGRPAPRLPQQAPPAELSAARQRAQPRIYVEDRCRPMTAAETCQHLRDQLSETQRQRFNQQPSERLESDARIEQLRGALAGC